MKNILMITAVLIMLCPETYAATWTAEDTPAVQAVMSNRNAKKLEGNMLKLARPALKKTPMSAVMDNIEMMVMYSAGKKADKEEENFVQQATDVLKSYNKVSEIDDPDYHMAIYIDSPVKDRFSEIILYTSWPETSIMVFVGDFTIESLKKVGELSEQSRMERRKARK